MNKEDFNKVWKDSTREAILNQYYYDYIELRKVYSIIKEVREHIEHENFKRTILVGVSTKKYTRDILNNILEILDKVEENK